MAETFEEMLARKRSKAETPPAPGEDFNALLARKRVEAARSAAVQGQEGGSVTDPEVGHVETFANRATETLPLGRLLVNLLSTGVMQGAKALGAGQPSVRFTPEALAEAKGQGLPVNEESAIPGLVDTYRLMRDTRDSRTDVGSRQNPWTARAGTGFGALLSAGMPLPTAMGGGSVARQLMEKGLTGIPQAARIGAGMGALQALGDSRADLTSGKGGEFLQQGLETGLGAALGAGGGALAQAAPTAARALGQRMQQWGTSLGRRTLQSGARTFADAMPTSDEAVREALRSGAILPFGTTQGAASRLENLADDVGKQYSDIIEGLDVRGVQGPLAEPLAEQLERRAFTEYATSGEDKRIANLFLAEAKNLREVADAEGRLGIKQVEEIKRKLQRLANYRNPNESVINPARKEVASIARQANEDAIEEAAQLATDPEIIERAESFVPVKRRLGRVLEARDAAEEGARRGANRATFSLGDKVLAAGAGDLGTGVATAVGAKVARNRLPSTGAAGLYWGGEALQGMTGLPQRFARTPLGQRLGVETYRPQAGGGAALSDTELEGLSEWLAGLTGQGAAPTEAQQTAAAVEALRRRRR